MPVDKRENQAFLIDVLRGLAAAVVFLSHADHNNLIVWDWMIRRKEFFGAFGVDLFFLLSGFLIWGSATATIPQPRGLLVYAIHRSSRVVPLYWVNVLFATFLLSRIGSTFEPAVGGATFLRHLTFTQALTPPVSGDLNPVLWTLTHEAIFYALVPFLFLAVRRFPPEAVLLVALAARSQPVLAAVPLVAPFLKVFYLFMIGVVAAERRETPLPAWTPLVFGGLAIVSASRGFDYGFLAIACSIAVFSAILVPTAAMDRGLHWTRWAMRPFAAIGVISYSLYIWHYLLLHILAAHGDALGRLLGPIWRSGIPRAVVTTAVSLAVSWASYRLIERPSMGPLRSALLRRLRPPVAPLA